MARQRILIAKPGLDGHDRGARVVVDALQRAGFEVIYTGIRQTPESIAATAAQEAVDAIGLSILSGAHLELMQRLAACLEAGGLKEVPVFMGGIIPPEDIPQLQELGVREVFGPGTSTSELVSRIKSILEGVPS